MNANADLAAFPHMQESYGIGLTKREHLAALAMQGICANEQSHEIGGEIIACWSVQCADALIAELSKPKEESK